MIDGEVRVRLPCLLKKELNGNRLKEAARLHPIKLPINLNMIPLSTASITIPESDPDVAMHDMIELFNQHGSVGVFRVVNITPTYKKSRLLELNHAIDILNDSNYPGNPAGEEKFNGTASAFLSLILGAQKQKLNGQNYWQLGQCDDTGNYKKEIHYDNVLEDLIELGKAHEDFVYTFDFSVFPWRVNFIRRTSDVLSEFRLGRNIESLTPSISDKDMCTRLHLSITQHETVTEDNQEAGDKTTEIFQTYDDAAAQAIWGVIEKTAGIDQNEVPDVNAWVQDYFSRHNTPSVQLTMNGIDLRELTGETIDEAHLGRICRVALPAYSTTFLERIISVSYPDAIRQPTRITVSMANKRLKTEDSIATARKETAKVAKASVSAVKRVANTKTDLEKQKIKFQTKVEQDDRHFALIATESEWDGLAQAHVTAMTKMNRTSRYIEDEAKIELPFDEWKAQWLVAHPEDASLSDAELRDKYNAWIAENPYAIWNREYSDARRTERIISKTGINSLGENETLYTKTEQTATEVNALAVRTETVEGEITVIEGTGVFQNSERITQVAGKFSVDQAGNVHVIDGSNLYLGEGNASLTIYKEGDITAGFIAEQLTGDNSGTAAIVKMGTYINNQLDAGTMITKITDPNLGTAYQTTFGTYVNGKLDAGVMVQKINDNTTTTILGSKVTIGNSNKTVDGKFEDVEVEIAGKVTAQEVAATYATISELNAQKARFDNLESPNGGIVGIYSGSVNASDTITAPTLYANSSLSIGTGTSGGSGSLYYRGTQYFRQAIKMGGVAGSIALGYFLGDSTTALNLDHYHSISAVEGTGANAGKILLTLGAPQLSAGTANFNIAATQYYQDGVAAAQEDGWELAYGMVTPPGQGTGTSFTVQVPDETYNTAHTYTFTIQKGATPASTGYASVALSGQVVGRISIGDWYDAGVTAGIAQGADAVTLSSEWSGSGDSYTFTVTASNEKTVSTTISYAETDWTQSYRKTITVTATNKPNDSRLFQHTVDASSLVANAGYAGRAAVGLSEPSADTRTTLNSTRTFTVSTTGRTNASGTTDNLSETVPLHLYAGSFGSNNKATVYLKWGATAGSSGTNYAQVEVDASSLVSDATTAGKLAVTLNDPTWNAISGDLTSSRTVSVSTSGRTPSLSKSIPLFLTVSGQTVYLRADSSSGTAYAKATVPATAQRTATKTTVAWRANTSIIYSSGVWSRAADAVVYYSDGESQSSVDVYGAIDVSPILSAASIGSPSCSQGICTFPLNAAGQQVKTASFTLERDVSWSGNTATVSIGQKSNGSMVNTWYSTTIIAPDQTVYYWENNTRYSFPSGGKRLSGGVDIMVGTSTSNRYWVLYPTATTLSSAWSGSGDTQTYTLTGDNVNSKSMSLTYTESAWSNGSKTITVTSSDKPNDNRVFQHTVTAPSASISTSWSSSGSGTYQYTYTASTSSDSKSMTIQNVYLLELSGNIWASGNEYYQHGEASLKISDNGSTVYKNHIDCYGGVDVTAAVNFGRNLGGGAWYVWDNGTQYDPPSGDIDVYAGHDIMVGTSLSNRKWVIAHNTVTTMQPDGAVYNYSTHPSWGTFYIKVSVGGRWYEMQCYASQSYNSL